MITRKSKKIIEANMVMLICSQRNQGNNRDNLDRRNSKAHIVKIINMKEGCAEE